MAIDRLQKAFRVPCLATVMPAEPATERELALASAVATAGPPLITNGKPTVMRMTAWMAHEGVNRNRLAFIGEELKVAAEKIGVTSPLVMDFNHSAIIGFDGEQKCIGVWSSAEYAFDAKAKNGAGAWGILVQGVMFSWLFPDIADALLAAQARHERIEFSMTCIAGSDEYAADAEGNYYIIAHNPVFFTNSALDVPPADPDAVGLGSESTDAGIEDAQRESLLQLAAAAAAPLEEQAMNEELKALLAGMEASLAAKITAAFEAVQGAPAEIEDGNVAQTTIDTLTARVAELELQLTEKETAVSVAQAQLSEIEAQLFVATESNVAYTAQVTELTEQLAAFEAAAAEAQRATTLAARLAMLPEKVRDMHAARDEAKRSRLESKWIAMSDADWSVYLEDELGVATAALGTSYLERSQREVPPLAGADDTATIGERLRRHIVK